MSSDFPNPIRVQIARGSYQFIVENAITKNLGIGKSVTTPKFSVGGYNWHIKYFPHGSVAEDNGTYIALSLHLQRPSRSVTADYELGLLNKYGKPTTESWIRSTDTFHTKQGWVYNRFMKRSDLESDYIRDDHFIVVCSITVKNEPCAVLKTSSIGVFPYNFTEEFRALLEKQEETDVTFELEGENISAHRLILASRSPLFRAELFGPMVETNCKCIKIDDMKPLVFRAMLHFMYTDTLPDVDDIVSKGTSDMNMCSTILYQHLVGAADRYALEGLKVLCEERLRRTISIETVMSSLAVAEQHNCYCLKDECLEFIAESENFVEVVLSEDYITLGRSCPSLVGELLSKIELAAVRKYGM